MKKSIADLEALIEFREKTKRHTQTNDKGFEMASSFSDILAKMGDIPDAARLQIEMATEIGTAQQGIYKKYLEEVNLLIGKYEEALKD